MRSLFAALLALALVAGCAGESDHDYLGYVMDTTAPAYTTPNGVSYMATASVTEQEGWPDAVREIDAAVTGFRSGSGGLKLEPLHIHFHEMTAETTDERAEYVGGGVIEACYHAERVPHTFCLSEAIRDLAAAQHPEAREWQLSWGEEVSSSWVGALYGLEAPLD